MKQHVVKVAATCHYHPRQIRRSVGTEVTIRLVLALLMSTIDYCKSALPGLPQSTIAALQRVQNAARRLVFELSTSDHITSDLIELLWIPVQWRIKFKLCGIMHSVFYCRCPVYLTATVQSPNASRPHMVSVWGKTSSTDFSLPQLRTPCLESVLSRMPVSLHGTQCPNTSVMNMNVVFLGNCCLT